MTKQFSLFFDILQSLKGLLSICLFFLICPTRLLIESKTNRIVMKQLSPNSFIDAKVQTDVLGQFEQHYFLDKFVFFVSAVSIPPTGNGCSFPLPHSPSPAYPRPAEAPSSSAVGKHAHTSHQKWCIAQIKDLWIFSAFSRLRQWWWRWESSSSSSASSLAAAFSVIRLDRFWFIFISRGKAEDRSRSCTVDDDDANNNN